MFTNFLKLFYSLYSPPLGGSSVPDPGLGVLRTTENTCYSNPPKYEAEPTPPPTGSGFFDSTFDNTFN